jgi:hypothetical protein
MARSEQLAEHDAISFEGQVCGVLGDDNAMGAQTERWGAAGLVSAWLGGED